MKHTRFDQYTRLYFIKSGLSPRLKARIRRWCRQLKSPVEISTLCLTPAAIKRGVDIPYEELKTFNATKNGECFIWFHARQPGDIVLHATVDRLVLMHAVHNYIIHLASNKARRNEIWSLGRQPVRKLRLAN